MLGCGPRATGPWRPASPARPPTPDLRISRCDPEQACQLEFVSFTGARWTYGLDPRKPLCSVWLSARGQWVQQADPSHLLELWIDQGPHCPALSSRALSMPRWMLLAAPIESAQSGGMGTRMPRHTYSRQSQRVRQALARGWIDGVLSLGHGETELLQDLEVATMRSSRQWLARRIFALIYGHNPSLGDPPLSTPGRSHRPQLWTQAPDITLDIYGLISRVSTFELVLRRPSRIARFELPRFAPQQPALRNRAAVEPCLDCGPRRDDLLELDAPPVASP